MVLVHRWLAPAFLIALGAIFLLAPFPFKAKLDAIPYGLDPQRPGHTHFFGDTHLPGEDWLRANVPGFAAFDPAEPMQLSLEARKVGMYVGFLAVWIYLAILGRARAKGMPAPGILVALIIFVGIMGFDGFNAFFYDLKIVPHLYEPRLDLRLATGLLCGYAFAGILTPVVNFTLWRANDTRPLLANWKEFAIGFVPLVVVYALASSGWGIWLYPLSIISSASVLILVALINVVFLLIVFRKESTCVTWRDALNPFAAGIACALAELGALSALRYIVLGNTPLP
ncbi:MAG: DUF2085 domain-containing protein [Chloroflexi bacterium]|nr:DUF2085 domain-containing protein [Chloroflexota bacterium]